MIWRLHNTVITATYSTVRARLETSTPNYDSFATQQHFEYCKILGLDEVKKIQIKPHLIVHLISVTEFELTGSVLYTVQRRIFC